ncbi:MAG: transglycosylase domain-containing protein [Clostridium sp.]
MAKDNISKNNKPSKGSNSKKHGLELNKNNDGLNGGKKKKSKNRTKKSKGKKILKYSLLSLLLLFLSVCVVGIGYIFAVIKATPELDDMAVEKIKNGNQSVIMTSKNGTELDAPAFSETVRVNLDSKNMPQNLKDAIVSIEDERFYEHSGIDIKRIAGALVYDVKYVLTGKGGVQGASTLTQQLIKNTVLTNERSIDRKIKEIFLALQLEKQLSKDEILTSYLNNFPVGGTSYGAEAGAKYYFNKKAKDLSLIECAYLAGVTQATHTYNAFNTDNQKDPTKYINRTKTVLSKMKEHTYITEKEYNDSIKALDSGKLKFKRGSTNYNIEHESFLTASLDQVKKDLKAKFKSTDEEVNNMLATGGLQIQTTLDEKLQTEVQKIIDDPNNYNIYGASKKDKNGIYELQGATAIIDYRTNEAVAMVGGRGKQPARSNNRAYSDLRSVGSAIKPLTSYGPAIDQKVMTAGSVIDDAQTPKTQKVYKGVNSPNSYKGLLTLRESLKYSSNIGSSLTANEVGVKTGVKYGEQLGLVFNEHSQDISTVALGQFNNRNGSDGGNAFKVASAYGVFGNGGVYSEPKLYTKVLDRNGNIILESNSTKTNVFSPQTAYILYDMLKEPLTYNGGSARFGAMPVSGKTGTTSSNKDYWFAGLTPHYSAAVWVGYDDQRPIQGGGSGRTAANLWGKIMAVAHKGLSTTDIKKPNGIVTTSICMDSGKLPTALCRRDPRGNRIRSELFISGTQPTGYCETHVEAEVNKNNNLLANGNTPAHLRVSKVFIKKDYPNSNAADSKYALPTKYDDSKYVEPETEDEAEDLEDQDLNEGNTGGATTPPTTPTDPPTKPVDPPKPPNPVTPTPPPTEGGGEATPLARKNKFTVAA